MRSSRLAGLTLGAVLVGAAGAAVLPTVPCSPAALARAEARIESQCDCAGATRHPQYARCAVRAIRSAVRGGTLARACRPALVRAAVRSTCGRAGAVTCCRTTLAGTTGCRVKRTAGGCTAHQPAKACVATHRTCADACTATGCAP
jgi:hypothetical protein